MSKVKRIFSLALAFCLVLPCMFLFTACGDKDTTRVMNVSLNPAIEFVLSKDDKVVTVNATNDEGNYIVANVSFEGLSAEDAVDLFLKTVKENGYLIEGNVSAGVNELEIEISGENAKKLFNSVKKSAKEYLSSVSINANIEFESINKDELRDLVEECMQELSESDINKMSEEQLINLIKTSREETKNLLSEELKELYYETRAEEILSAKFTEISNLLASSLGISSTQIDEFNNSLATFKTKLSEFKTEFETKYLSSTSNYQLAMQDYIAAKKALLEARLDGIDTTNLEMTLDQAEQALESAKNNAEAAVDLIESAMESAISSVNMALNVIANFLNQDTINAAVNSAKENFKTNFASEYSQYINNNYWNTLAPSNQE